MSNQPPKLLDQVRNTLRVRHYAFRTEKTYLNWIKRFILFHDKRHPKEMAEPEVEAFLTHLAVDEKVTASTQNQAFSALLFLYKHVLNQELHNIDALRATHPPRLPVVMTKQETQQVIDALPARYQLIAQLLYGSGLRLIECLRLRVKDIDFAQNQITVYQGKGNKDRRTMLPERVKAPLQSHLNRVKLIHQKDLKEGYGCVYLPNALEKKYPNACREWRWQYVFPAPGLATDPRTGLIRRHHLGERAVQQAVRETVNLLGVTKRITCHTFRHSFATHLLEAGYGIRTVQELLGHKDVRTTMIYTRVLNKDGLAVRSPLDD